MPRRPVQTSTVWATARALLIALTVAVPAQALVTTPVTPTVTTPATTAPLCLSAEADDEPAEVRITGQILYDARRGKDPVPAVVDIVSVYGSHPA